MAVCAYLLSCPRNDKLWRRILHQFWLQIYHLPTRAEGISSSCSVIPVAWPRVGGGQIGQLSPTPTRVMEESNVSVNFRQGERGRK